MEILPPIIELPENPFQRQHSPDKTDNHSSYNPCLRWEFGFICPFCFIPANNFSWHGVIGGYQMSVEHRTPQSSQDSDIHNYDNCYYACMYCNNSRGSLPIENEEGEKILAPDEASWGNHFEYDDFELVALSDDAEYTLESYDLNDPRKVKIRQFRYKRLTNALKYFNGLAETYQKVNELLSEGSDVEEKFEMIDALKQFREERELAKEEIKDFFRAIPDDVRAECKCDSVKDPELPIVISKQTKDIDVG